MEPEGWARAVEALERIAGALEAGIGEASGGLGAAPEGRAFTWRPSTGFRPLHRVAAVPPGLLAGIDRQKEAFYGNVARFLTAAPAHDTLFWGDRGTGKSSLARSLLSVFDDERLALLSLDERDIPSLPRLLDCLEPDPRRWVLFLDDLTFRGPGGHWRELKVLLEGGLEARPGNTLVVATSNRRHLVPESFSGDEVHPEEAVAEALSLADRFGLSLGFYPFDEPAYLDAVARHLGALGHRPPDDSWRLTAVRWALTRGIRSGRTARQAAVEITGRGAVSFGP